MQTKYLLSDIDFDDLEIAAVTDVVHSKWLSLGPKTAEFESRFCEELGAKHAVAVSSCTAALHLALMALDIGPGDEVLVPSYTFVASANSILYQRATPVFVDINGPHDLNLDVDDLEAKITPRTKAIMVVHMAGFLADMDRIMAIAEKQGLVVVEDACHAIGATYVNPGSPYDGRQAGTIGHAGCFSFFANKNLPAGEGGMLVTGDEALANRVRLSRSHGMSKTSWDKANGRAHAYDVVQLGFNYRCTEITAALGLAQLAKLPAANERRKRLVEQYRTNLAQTPGITIPFADRLDDSSHHIFPIVVDDPHDREPFRQRLLDCGIQTSVHYPPIHEFSLYRAHTDQSTDLAMTEDVAAREVTLPLHPLLSASDVDIICRSVNECLAPVEAIC